jgi:hypothetical protein
MARRATRRSTCCRRRWRRRSSPARAPTCLPARAADAPEFRAGRFDTGFIDRNLAALGATKRGRTLARSRLGAARFYAERQWRGAASDPDSPWSATDAFQFSGARRTPMKLNVDGEKRSRRCWSGRPRRRGTLIEIDGRPPRSSRVRAATRNAISSRRATAAGHRRRPPDRNPRLRSARRRRRGRHLDGDSVGEGADARQARALFVEPASR